MVKVSVIVPVYNVDKYLDRCMESLVGQTLQDIEIILVDDGSPDQSPAKCDDYAVKDPRVKVIHKQNQGLGFARNSGLEIASGEYVAFVDSDDFVDLTMYETLYHYSDNGTIDAVFCGLRRYWNEQKIINRCDVSQHTIFRGNQVRKLALDFISSAPECSEERRYEMSVWHSIYKRETLSQHNLKFLSEREILSEDLPFQVSFFLLANRVTFIPDILYSYCMNNSSSLTNTFSIAKFQRMKNLYAHLNTLVCNIEGYETRTNRFMIGYTRSLCMQIVGMHIQMKDKLKFLEAIIKDEIWSEFADYNKNQLPLYARFLFIIQMKKSPFIFYYSCKLASLIKNLVK